MFKLDQESLDFILESAVLAPSADNRHRIRFRVDGNSIHIRYTEFLPHHGYKRVLALLSLGAVTENLTIAASRFGLGAQTTFLSDPMQPGLTIQICLNPGPAVTDPLWEIIPLRHTNRRLRFRGPKMTDLELSDLDATVRAYPSTRLVWLDEPKWRKSALSLMRRAETERFHNRILHEELFSAIRFDVGWNASCSEGLPPGALAVEAPMRPLFAWLRHWPVMRLANFLGAHHILGMRACDLPCRFAPNLGLLAVEHTDNHSVLDAGRSFQRLWLTLTKQGRVLQAMPASALYALDGVQAEGICPILQRQLNWGWKSRLPAHSPLILFRIGFAKPLIVKAARRPSRHYLESKN